MSPTPKTNEVWISRLVKRLKKRARTIGELAAILEVSDVTVYKYLRLLQLRGFNVRRVNLGRPAKYRIER